MNLTIVLALPPGELDRLADQVQTVVACHLMPRDSSYVGPYRSGTLGDVAISVRGNTDPIDGELQIDGADRSEIIIVLTGPSVAAEALRAAISAHFEARVVSTKTSR